MDTENTDQRDNPSEPTPFSFKLMIVLAIIYLGWRLVEGVAALIRWIS